MRCIATTPTRPSLVPSPSTAPSSDLGLSQQAHKSQTSHQKVFNISLPKNTLQIQQLVFQSNVLPLLLVLMLFSILQNSVLTGSDVMQPRERKRALQVIRA